MEVTMTTNRKNELIAQLVNILSELIEANDSEKVTDVKSDAVEMLTVKECTEAVKGLSEHTVRKLIKQGKLPYLRTGDGVKGKMLINKADLLAYFNGQTADK
ncbi:MAG: helix-turn-helix domain-containing protein [Oscillospiraceae bacterium]